MAKTTPLRPKQGITEMVEAFNDLDLDAIMNLLADDVEWVNPIGAARGKDAFRMEIWEPFMAMLDELDATWTFAPDIVLEDGSEGSVFGTGIQSIDGKEVATIPIAQYWRFEDGKVARFRGYPDTKLLLDAFGVEE